MSADVPGVGADRFDALVRSSLAVPLPLSSGDTVGALNLYGDVAGGFSATDEELGHLFAAQGAVVVSNAHAYWAALDQARNLSIAMESRAVIEQAKGVLMVTHRVGPDAAFDMLRRRSQSLNRKLHAVAADVVNEAFREHHEPSD